MTQAQTQISRRLNSDMLGEPNGDPSGMVEVAMTRAAQEVQAAMVIAKRFPRDENTAFARIMRACKRKQLAEAAIYAYPKGGTNVQGPSIRLAEALAQAWGNIDFGVIELEQKNGESTMMSYAWDLETNSRCTKIFTVRHERHTRQGVTKLNDPRDVYELAANQGSRRLRACILSVIPGDVIESAVEACEKTMAGNNSEPLSDRIRMMVAAFSEIGVTQEMIANRLQHKVDVTTEPELVQLKKIYRSLRDGMSQREDFFPNAAQQSKPSNIQQRVDESSQGKPAPKTAPEQSSDPESDAIRDEIRNHDWDGKGDEPQADAAGADDSQVEQQVGPSDDVLDSVQALHDWCLEASQPHYTPGEFEKAWNAATVHHPLKSARKKDQDAKRAVAIAFAEGRVNAEGEIQQ